MAKKSEKLTEIRGMMKGLPREQIETIGTEPLKELRETFEQIPDKR